MKNNNKGFSLVELIVVIAIMAILAAIAIPTFAHFITKANEASDAELLHNINYIFNASCVENGVDIKDVTAAEWDKTNKRVINVKVNGTDNDDIEASFATHFDLTEEEFKLIENIVFDAEKHEFVAADGDTISVVYNGVTITLSSTDIQKIKDSAFAQIGTDNLLTMVDMASDMISSASEGSTLHNLAYSDEAIAFLCERLGVSNEQEIGDILMAQYPQGDMSDDEYNAFLDEKYNEMIANNAVLYAAQKTEVASEGIWDVLNATNVKDTIKANENAEEQLAQSAMAFAMYSAYTKTDSIENVSLTEVYATLDSADFKEYLTTPQAKKDLDGYLASMNVVNDGVSSGSGAAQNVLLNGFSDEELADLMKQVVGN